MAISQSGGSSTTLSHRQRPKTVSGDKYNLQEQRTMGDFKVRSSNQALRGSKQASTRRWPALRGEGRSGEGRARRRNTVSAVLDQFMKCHARKLRSADRVKKALDDYPSSDQISICDLKCRDTHDSHGRKGQLVTLNQTSSG
jgi:hypothetical protein